MAEKEVTVTRLWTRRGSCPKEIEDVAY